jgi:hypothetical protein
MRVYTPAELRRFLAGMDEALEHPAEIVVVGGAAAAIEYGVASGTRDIDSILLKRYQEEMTGTIIDPARLRGQVLTMVERLFPSDLDSAERQLGGVSDRSGKAGPVHGAPQLQGAALPVETPANDASRHSAFPSRKAGQYGKTMGSSKPAV